MQGILLPQYKLDALIDQAIELLRAHIPTDGAPYYGCFSGGKDSTVIKELARMSGVPVVWHYNMTTIDPPEVIYYMRKHHPDVIFEQPKYGNFFTRMDSKGFPTRTARWCCEEYKESAPPKGAVMILGVRGAESPRRAKTWKPVTFHTRTKAWCVAPILSWSDEDVWHFIRSRNIPYCSLYDEGFERLGCIGCPMARADGKKQEFARWPRFEALWKRSFKRIWEKRAGTPQRDGREWFGTVYFKGWEDMWNWWLSNDSLPAKLAESDEEDSCQLALNMLSGGGDVDGEEEEP